MKPKKTLGLPRIGHEAFIAAGWDTLPVDDGVLDELELVSFAATPQTIRPYERTTLSWEIKGPTNKVNLALDGEAIWTDPDLLARIPIEAVGTQDVSPLTTTAYRLKAQRGAATKIIGTATVEVDTAEVKVRAMAGTLIQQAVVSYIERMFTRSSSVSLRGDATAMLDEVGLNATIPLEIEVPNYFNADTDIDLFFYIFAHRSGMYTNGLVTELGTVDIDVRWHWLEHLAGLIAPTAICQAALQAALESLIISMLADSLEDNLSSALNSFDDFGVADLLRTMGGQGRPYLLHSINVVPLGIDILGCPDPRE